MGIIKETETFHKPPNVILNGVSKRLFDGIRFIVEATSYEKYALWHTWFAERRSSQIKSWEQSIASCPLLTLAMTGDRPINIVVFRERINGHDVIFWEAVSSLVDHTLINAFFEKHAGNIERCDANNFHQCIHYLNSL